MPRYNFLDEAGLKQYHKLAGYSEIPIADIVSYVVGKLDGETGEVHTGPAFNLYYTSDYIELPINMRFVVASGDKLPDFQPCIICYYNEDDEIVSYDTFTDPISFTLKDKIKDGVSATKIRISALQQFIEDKFLAIRTLHKDATRYLYDDITETNKLIIRLHATYGISISPTTIEKGVKTSINIKDIYFRFDGKGVAPGHYIIMDGDGSAFAGTLVPNGDIINTSNTVTDTEVRDNKTYTLSITHLGSTFTKTASVSAYYPMYFGSSGNESISKDNLNTIFSTATTIGTAKEVSGVGVFTKQPISGSPNGTRNFKVNSSQYIYLLVPSTMTINKVTSSGFAVPMSSTAPEVTGTNKGSYRVYRSEKKVNGGTLSIVIS